ncbi:MAG: hypothetical protein B6D57_01685 [Candidatus Coatesbacteria bacterium 4484_99]|uniref:N-acetyltransferase domain-containing protein n=1 Tax=Candidatus Coatesbacteria bacterium 4484_99 TaxID=1970774 RepID=A0A1W9S2I7_9BACT|nr:MAG: hypothetical protein B6D57_01685 [Candidatus Coatesbacteria bacterium 4484_99]RLC41290.1 MAG: hypothetical protein DRH51_03495 [Candidatus Coatesbacteria bacterium]RLC42678.1 MAG: hypothetical protein DRH49_03430 [Candidatus Coatesbacteria bacterium]
MNSNILIREMNKEDLENVVIIHNKAFPYYFMTHLGNRFLYHYYATFLNSNHSLSLVSEEKGNITGFVVGPHKSLEHKKEAIKYLSLRLIPIILYKLIFSPGVIAHILLRFGQTIRILVKEPKAPPSSLPEPRALLASIAVSKKARLGTGISLINEFTKRMKELGTGCVITSTDSDNKAAKRAFLHSNFKLLDQKCIEGRMIERYIFVCK